MVKTLSAYAINLFKLLMCSAVCPLFSAGPVMHLWVAERFCEIYAINDPDTVRDILIGTEFPDIRYITHEPRDLTHPETLEIQEVLQSTTPFEMGMKLHVWVDCVREHFVLRQVYDAIAPHAHPFSATFLKLIEEEILADFYDGRQWVSCFNEMLPEELALTSEEMVSRWHQIIQCALSVKPSWLLWGQSYRGALFGVPADTLYSWSYLIPQLKRELIFQHHLYALLSHLEEELLKGHGQ